MQNICFAPVAQLDRASAYGAGCWRFKSSQAHHTGSPTPKLKFYEWDPAIALEMFSGKSSQAYQIFLHVVSVKFGEVAERSKAVAC